jgi:hypothetical protein
MLSVEYREALKKLGLTPDSKTTAAVLGLSVRQCQRLGAGHSKHGKVPPTVERLLLALLAHAPRTRRRLMRQAERMAAAEQD